MDTCDVLIVGGGPAGSSCARALVRAGLDVRVLDKSPFPRDKVCAGWITPQVVETLQLDLADYGLSADGRARVLQPIRSFTAGLIERQGNAVDYDRIVSYGIRRCEFDHYLLERSGARLRLGEPLATLERQGNRWCVNDSIQAAFVVGAGGHFCPVARHLGASLGHDETVVAAQEVEFELDAQQAQACGVAAERPELYFCDDLKGYGWCFRKGNFLNVGLGREDSHLLSERMKAFWTGLGLKGKVPAGRTPRFKGHAYLLYSHGIRTVAGEGMLLIGDAAGLAYPQSGEGIRPAIESALLAAQVIVESGADPAQAKLETYEARLRERFGARQTAAGISAVIPAKARAALGRRLMRSRRFTRHVVLDRWFLHAAQPALAVSGT